MRYDEIPIKINPTPKNISLLVSDVVALYNKTPPAKPKNNINIPLITGSKLVFVTNG